VNRPFALVGHSLRRVRSLIITMGVVLGLFQLLIIVVASAMERSHTFASLAAALPPFVREFLGNYTASFMSFSGMVCQGYFHPLVVSSLVAVAITLATMPASEIESGFMDLLLSRPLARHRIITRTIVVVVLCSLILLVVMTTCTWAGLSFFAPKVATQPAPRVVLSMAVNLGLLMLCWGGVAMAIGAASRSRGRAGTIAGLLALVTYLLDFLARVWPPAEKVVWLSPFHYYNAFDLIMGRPLHVDQLLVLAGGALTGYALAYVFFSRRDVSR
jgi:ABC-2 type transport system permease protein